MGACHLEWGGFNWSGEVSIGVGRFQTCWWGGGGGCEFRVT